MAKVIYFNTQIGGIETLSAAVGDGRTLGLNPTQFDTLKANANAQIIDFRSKVQEPASQDSLESITPEPEVAVSSVDQIAPEGSVTSETPVMSSMEQNVEMEESTEKSVIDVDPSNREPVTLEPVVSETQEVEPVIPEVTPVSVTSEIPVENTESPVIPEITPSVKLDEPVENPVHEVVQPESESAPVIPSPVIQEEAPAPLPGQVEIVSNNPDNTDYDKLMVQIADINANYDRQIADLNQKRTEEIKQALEENKNKLIDYEAKIKDLQGRAEEHLKNAQAAETIATIAQANAQKNME